MPMEKLDPRPNFHVENQQARNAEEALLAVLNICARLTQKLSEIEWSSRDSFGTWISRLQGQRVGPYVFCLNCLSFLQLSGCLLYFKDFYMANLKRADLRGAHLSEANLERANLREANLAGAHLSEANLKRANLREANLAGAHLSGANLEGANLSGANLERANLRGAHLEGANLKGTILEGKVPIRVIQEAETERP